MSRMDEPLTDEGLRDSFNRAIQAALDMGVPAPSDTGLGYEVENAILEVALAFPDGTSKVDAAKQIFEKSLQPSEN